MSAGRRMLRNLADSFRFALHRVRLAGGTPGRGSAIFRSLLVLLVAAAAIVRLMRSHAGLPYVHTWDEPQMADSALRIMKSGDLNPHFFTYGSVLIYLYVLVDIFHYLFLMGRPETAAAFLTSLDDIKTHFETGWLWTISHPSFYLWNRYLMAMAGAAAVAVSYGIGRKLGGRGAGLLAAALLGSLAVHVRHSALVTPDVMVSFLAAGSALLAILYLEKEKPIYLILSLAVAGLTASTKYNAALCVVTPVTALAIAAATRHRAYRPWLWAAVPLVPAAFFLLGTPYALLDLKTFLATAGREVRVYRVVALVGNEVDRAEPGLAHAWLQLGYFARNLGLPGALLAVTGLVVAASRKIGWLLLPFPILYFYVMTGSLLPFERNFMGLYPFIAAAFGAGAMLVYRWARETAGPRRALSRAAAAILLAGLSLWLSRGWSSAAAAGWEAVTRLETRTTAMQEAGRLAARRAGATARLGIAEELRIHPDDLRALEVPHEVRPFADLLCDAGRYTILVAGLRHGAYSRAFDPLAETWNDLPLDRGFETLEEIRGEILNVDVLSANPGVRLLAPREERGSPKAICLDAAPPSDYFASGAKSFDGKGNLEARLEGPISSPGFFLSPGDHALVWRAAGEREARNRPRVRARVEAARDGGGTEVLGELILPLTPRPQEFAIRFTTRESDLVVLRLEEIVAGGAGRSGVDGLLVLGPVRVLGM